MRNHSAYVYYYGLKGKWLWLIPICDQTMFNPKANIALCCIVSFCVLQLVMDAVLEIMYKAVVPWNDTIEKFVQQHLEKEHPKY